MAKSKAENSGCAGIFLLLLGIGLLAMIPAPVWIAIGAVVVVLLLTWLAVRLSATAQQRRAARAEAAAQAERERIEAARRQRIVDLGEHNAVRVDAAEAAVQHVLASEAAQAGWLGDVDFTDDLQNLVTDFARTRALRSRADELARLDAPTEDDYQILTDARRTAGLLEQGALARVQLIQRCATEAQLIDDSLARERADAATAEQRAALHRDLNAMLYGIANAPNPAAVDSAADRVMARVAGYRELKRQIRG